MGWHQLTDRWYWRLQARVVPGLRNSQYEYADALRAALPAAHRWLDLGCGHDFLPPWMSADDARLDAAGLTVVGIDADPDALSRHKGLTARIQGNIEALPFQTGVFDLVTANMVIEHVEYPEALFHEVQRILAPGGRFIVHTPNDRGYTTLLTRLIPGSLRAFAARLLLGRDERDVYPTFYRANSSAALTTLARAGRLQVAAVRHVESSAQLIAVPPLLVLELLAARLFRRNALAKLRPCLVAVFEKPRITPGA